MSNERIPKLEMAKKKKKNTKKLRKQAPQIPPRPIHSPPPVLIHVKMFSTVQCLSLLQVQLKDGFSLNSVPWGATNPSVWAGKESNQSAILWNSRHSKWKWRTKKVCVLNEKRQSRVVGIIPRLSFERLDGNTSKTILFIRICKD